MYEDNPLGTPGASEIAGMPIDLGMIQSDIYLLGGTTDHITPWKSMYRNTALFGGDITYVLSNSGHVQCMVNPPGNPKASYLTNDTNPERPSEYLETATQHPGSWWPHWAEWLGQRSGGQATPPAECGSEEFPPLCDAPGTYVHQK
jgi:polyhydroxyalkanoate synthase